MKSQATWIQERPRVRKARNRRQLSCQGFAEKEILSLSCSRANIEGDMGGKIQVREIREQGICDPVSQEIVHRVEGTGFPLHPVLKVRWNVYMGV